MADAKRRLIPSNALKDFVRDIFIAAGTSAEHASDTAEVLVWANMRGVDSHGISRIPRYIEMFGSGEAKAKPNLTVKKLQPAVLLVEADAALGPVAMKRAMAEAITLARTTGIAWASVRGTTLTGAIGYYTDMAAQSGMIGIGLVSGIPNMGYFGAKGAALATSPLSIAVPAGDRPPVLLDMATATVALNKLQQLKQRGEPLPEGIALTKEGLPTTDPAQAAIPTPMSGAKGSGMSFAFELLTSVLASNPILTPFHQKTPEGRRHKQNGAVIALNVSAFGDPAAFTQQVDAAIDTLKKLPRLDDAKEILIPGERSAATFAQRERDGISIAPKAWAELAEVAQKLGVAIPPE